MEQNKDQSDAAVRGEAVAEFNINDTMIVTLTEFGAKIWNDRWNDIPVPGHLIPNPVSAGHVLKDQMWDLMKTFGPHIYLGGDMPFLNAMMAHEKVSARAADAPSEPIELQWRAQFWKLALALNCFPSQFIDANEHVFEAVESLKSRAADALDSQPTMHKDVEWLLECAEMAKRNPELATALRDKCRVASSQPTDGGVRNG